MTSEETTQFALCKWCHRILDGETIEVVITPAGTQIALCSDGCVDDYEASLTQGLFRLVAGGT